MGTSEGSRAPGRGRPGWFRAVGLPSGGWTLLDPEDQPFLLRAVHGVRATVDGDDGVPPRPAATLLRGWGFNADGVGGDGAGAEDGLPFLCAVGAGVGSAWLTAPGLRLPDVFAPEWPRLVAARVEEVCAPRAEDRQLIGWVTDADLDWAQAVPGGGPSLLQRCLSLEPSFAAYHAAWEFVLALHGGRLDAVSRAWGVPLANKEVVRELTRSERGLATRGYLRDEAQWSREYARRYFGVTGATLRAADPNHLLFGCRFASPAGPAVLAECAYPAVDVAMPHWTELPLPGPLGTHPVVAGDLRWNLPSLLAPGTGRERRLTTVERMLRRARAALDRLAAQRHVVGYAWAAWQDVPSEQPPFGSGLLHAGGGEAREHTELLAEFNRRLQARVPSSSP